MNLINGTLIDLLLAAAESLREETCRILQQYRIDRDTHKRISEKYKNETEYFTEQQQKLAEIARAGIAKAERIFCNKIDEYANQMEQQLKKHLSMPINSQFREKLSMISEFRLLPEKIEIEDLISLNNGNQTGLAALAKTLEKVDSPYVLKYHTTADYQADIAKIRDLKRNLKYIPTEYHTEGTEVYAGTHDDYVYPNGGILGNGVSYDATTVSLYSMAFETSIHDIQNIKETWSADCSYEEADRHAETEKEILRMENQYLTAVGLPPEKEIAEPESGTTVEDNPEKSEAMMYAKQHGRDIAKARDTLAELKKAGQML